MNELAASQNISRPLPICTLRTDDPVMKDEGSALQRQVREPWAARNPDFPIATQSLQEVVLRLGAVSRELIVFSAEQLILTIQHIGNVLRRFQGQPYGGPVVENGHCQRLSIPDHPALWYFSNRKSH
ncbi:hypothetical protein [Bradyrhizobium sp. STM 3562]|uniref:hypothetical protein n=1 Tax=Bradyrhizobium sp. STM 3562 TaxID=578924 RepID=UPI00388D7A85